ncbi:hypothetical protein CVT25_002247 [Psilocybe cyanescens]|uniref:Uncharacterized protein n=1 Tax=Psilocybe cyanescens TaxID=93625 RepID=A0A409X5L4_PSICY|nr:hypothetical protein CVT25_002247 [Psilocybe cyanescens]
MCCTHDLDAVSSATASGLTSPMLTCSPCGPVVVVVAKDNNDNVVVDVPSTAAAALDMKYCHGYGFHGAGTSNSNQSSSRFSCFPLIEEDKDTNPAEDDNSDHIFPSFNNTLSSAERRQRVAKLKVQVLLLVIRLKGFLSMQGVPEAEFDVQFFTGSRGGSASDEKQKRGPEEDEEDEDRQMMDGVGREVRKIQLGQQELAPSLTPAPSSNEVQVPAHPVQSSPPPVSPEPMSVSRSARQRRAVLPTLYVIAFLLMKHRMTPARNELSDVGSGGWNWKKRIRERLEEWIADMCTGC